MGKLTIDLQALKQTDNWAPVMWELEQVIVKIQSQKKLGKLVTGIVQLPIFQIEEDNE